MKTPIESLLNLKRWEEDEAGSNFAVKLKELAVEEGRRIELEDSYAAEGMVLIQGGAVETTIEELKNRRDYMEFLINEIHKQERVIKAKENEVERARQVLIEVSMERRTFEKLDEKRKEAIEKEFLRKEQIVSDEHGTTGFSRGRL